MDNVGENIVFIKHFHCFSGAVWNLPPGVEPHPQRDEDGPDRAQDQHGKDIRYTYSIHIGRPIGALEVFETTIQDTEFAQLTTLP